MSIRDQLKSRKKREPINLGTDETLYIKTMSGLDRSDFMELSEKIDEENVKVIAKKNAALVALSLVDEAGEYIYSLDELDDILSDMESSDIDDVVKSSLKINKLTQEDQEGQEKN